MKKTIVLCADDYGQAPAISQGILKLIEDQRLSATTCMTTSPFWPEHANWLKSYHGQIDIGLHFNLTEGKALSHLFIKTYGQDLITLPKLMRLAFFRHLSKAALVAECHAQIDAFQEALGSLPRFLDGHQHVHQFPIVRSALIKVYRERLTQQKPYVRLVGGQIGLKDLMQRSKKIPIYLMGNRGLKPLLKKHKIPHNTSFSGIYSFTDATSYQHYFRQFLREIKHQGIIVCHPGLPSIGPEDPIATARYLEYRYLQGNHFLKDCEAAGIVLGQFF